MEAKLCVLMVWLVMCLCMNKAIAWLGCRLFVDMVSQLSLEYVSKSALGLLYGHGILTIYENLLL